MTQQVVESSTGCGHFYFNVIDNSASIDIEPYDLDGGVMEAVTKRLKSLQVTQGEGQGP